MRCRSSHQDALFSRDFLRQVLLYGLVMFANVVCVFFIGQRMYRDERCDDCSVDQRNQVAQTMTLIAW